MTYRTSPRLFGGVIGKIFPTPFTHYRIGNGRLSAKTTFFGQPTEYPITPETVIEPIQETGIERLFNFGAMRFNTKGSEFTCERIGNISAFAAAARHEIGREEREAIAAEAASKESAEWQAKIDGGLDKRAVLIPYLPPELTSIHKSARHSKSENVILARVGDYVHKGQEILQLNYGYNLVSPVSGRLVHLWTQSKTYWQGDLPWSENGEIPILKHDRDPDRDCGKFIWGRSIAAVVPFKGETPASRVTDCYTGIQDRANEILSWKNAAKRIKKRNPEQFLADLREESSLFSKIALPAPVALTYLRDEHGLVVSNDGQLVSEDSDHLKVHPAIEL